MPPRNTFESPNFFSHWCPFWRVDAALGFDSEALRRCHEQGGERAEQFRQSVDQEAQAAPLLREASTTSLGWHLNVVLKFSLAEVRAVEEIERFGGWTGNLKHYGIMDSN